MIITKNTTRRIAIKLISYCIEYRYDGAGVKEAS